MIKITLLPFSKIEPNLTKVNLEGSNESLITGLVEFDPVIKKDSATSYEFYTIEKDLDFNTSIIYIKSTPAIATPIHTSWIKGIEIDGTKYEIDNSRISASTLTTNLSKIPTTTQYTFIDLHSQTVFFDDTACSICGSSEDVTEHKICKACLDKALVVNSHSYRPDPVFFGESTHHYGLELEYGFTSKDEAAKIVIPHINQLYLKHDGSISAGEFRAEVVTHPHTFDELMKEGSILETVSKADTVKHTNHGCHIHISRSAFKDNKHYALFYFLVYTSKALLEYCGGRPLNDYCRFNKEGIPAKKANMPYPGERYKAINECNANTVEFRVFDSTTDTNQLKIYVQFVDSLIEYTRKVRATASLAKYFDFIAKHKKYAILNEHIQNWKSLKRVLGSVTDVTYKAPVIKSYLTSKLSLLDVPNINKITLTNGQVFVVDQTRANNTSLTANNLHLVGAFEGMRAESATFSLSDIASIEVIK